MTAAIYARKSTEQVGVADEQKSVARQVDHARQYAGLKGWTVDEASVFVDDGISGAEFTNRPGFLRLMNALKPRPGFQVLLMSEVSRLGREQIETAYALKQLSVAGVRCFSYLEDRELLMESATDKFLLSAVNFAAEIEREKGRQRTRDAMVRKAHAGHVTGGGCFGYRNVEIVGSDGKRSHVEREIEPTEANIVRQIFRLSATGYGVKAIAKQLNAEGAPSPRAQCGRSQSWAPSSVRAVLYRPLYRGEIVWAQTAKRDTWGRKHQSSRPAADWIRRPAAALRIVSDDEWNAAHARQTAARAVYMKGTGRQRFGRPALGNPSKHLLTNLALCGCCGGTLYVVSRSHGVSRKRFYGCSSHHERGICDNRADVPMLDADEIVIEALLDEVLDETIISDAVDEAVRLLQGDDVADRIDAIETQLADVERQRERLVCAIAAGGQLSGLLDGLREREAARVRLTAERDAVRSQRGLQVSEIDHVRNELHTLSADWRRVLVDDPPHARPIVSSLLKGRVPEHIIATAYADDEARASAEYGTQFRTDLEKFVTIEALEAVTMKGRTELTPENETSYVAFVDPSGGSSDSMTLADRVLEKKPPFNPETVVSDFADLLKAFRVRDVHGDRYGGEWPRQVFYRHGIAYQVSDDTKSDLYLATLPLIMANKAELLDDERLRLQFLALERRTTRNGKDVIDHPPGRHDDLSNAAAGALVRDAAEARQQIGMYRSRWLQ